MEFSQVGDAGGYACRDDRQQAQQYRAPKREVRIVRPQHADLAEADDQIEQEIGPDTLQRRISVAVDHDERQAEQRERDHAIERTARGAFGWRQVAKRSCADEGHPEIACEQQAMGRGQQSGPGASRGVKAGTFDG